MQEIPTIQTPVSRTIRHLHKEDGITGNLSLLESSEQKARRIDAQRLWKLRSALRFVKEQSSNAAIISMKDELIELITLCIWNRRIPEYSRTLRIWRLKKRDELNEQFERLVG